MTDQRRDPRSQAREFVIQFLYQCESEKIFHYSEGHFASFVQHFNIAGDVANDARRFARGTLDRLPEIDERLQETSKNWKLSRMAMIDRNILRLAVFELLESQTPPKVVLNEAIELAKKYGSAESGSFVNGMLDRLARSLRQDASPAGSGPAT